MRRLIKLHSAIPGASLRREKKLHLANKVILGELVRVEGLPL